MGKIVITYLLLSILIVENYVILKKYKNIIVNISTLMYIISVPFYCFISTPYEKFWGSFSMFTFALIMGISTYYIIKLAIKKEDRKFQIYGLSFTLFVILDTIIDKLV